MDRDQGSYVITLLSLHYVCTLGGDKVSMLKHTYPHKPLGKIIVTICNHQADSPLYVSPDVWSEDLQVYKSMVIRDTECPCLLRPGVIRYTNPTHVCTEHLLNVWTLKSTSLHMQMIDLFAPGGKLIITEASSGQAILMVHFLILVGFTDCEVLDQSYAYIFNANFSIS